MAVPQSEVLGFWFSMRRKIPGPQNYQVTQTHWIPKTMNLMANLRKVPIILVGRKTINKLRGLLWLYGRLDLQGQKTKTQRYLFFFGFIHETPHKTHLIFWSFRLFLWGEVEERYRRSDWSWGARRWVGKGWVFVGWRLCNEQSEWCVDVYIFISHTWHMFKVWIFFATCFWIIWLCLKMFESFFHIDSIMMPHCCICQRQ